MTGPGSRTFAPTEMRPSRWRRLSDDWAYWFEGDDLVFIQGLIRDRAEAIIDATIAHARTSTD